MRSFRPPLAHRICSALALALALVASLACSREPAAEEAAAREQPAGAADSEPGPGAGAGLEMVQLGGVFAMGTTDGFPFEGPVHEVELAPFWIDRHEVTIAQFARFAGATGYVTEAERFGWSGVFDPEQGAWSKVDGADWRHPDGPRAPPPRPNEPVTQVSHADAAAYCEWAKKRLPTEAEYELAARGGLAGARYAWGDELAPAGGPHMNAWQGTFPERDEGRDGYVGRAPVMSFPANGHGLFDLAGNVWEWCADWFDPRYYERSPRADPRGPERGDERVMRGGSWLCSENYCQGYRAGARNHTAADSGLNNLGFRCACDAAPSPAGR